MFPTIPTGERKAVIRLFVYSLSLAASYTLARTAGDSLFLSRIGSDSLAGVFVLSGVSTAIVALLWYALTHRWSLERSVRLSGLTFAALSFAAWWSLPQLHHSTWLFGAIYLLTEVKGCVNAINIVSSMNDVLGGHSSRQSWARIGMAVPLAGISMGALVGVEATWVTPRNWLLLAAFLDLAGVFLLTGLDKIRVPRAKPIQRQSLKRAFRKSETVSSFKAYACSKHFQFWVIILISAKVIVLTLVNFEWKVTASDFYANDESALSRYFGLFYAWIGVATLLLQIFVTGRLMRRRTIHIPILVMPIAFLILNCLLVAGGSVAFLMVVTSLAKFTEVWRRSVHDTTLNFLYTKIERAKRRQVIAINSAAVKPLSEVVASLVLLVGSVTIHYTLIIGATVLWLIAAISLLRRVRMLKAQPKPNRKAEFADKYSTT